MVSDNVEPHEVSTNEFNELLSHLDGREIQDSVMGIYTLEATAFRRMQITDGNRSVIVCPYDVASQSDPGAVEASFLVVRRDGSEHTVWRLPKEESASSEILPTVEYCDGEPIPDGPWTLRYQYRLPDGRTVPAWLQSDTPEESTTIVAAEQWREFPQKWFLETADGEVWYARERSGSIRVYNTVESTRRRHLVFSASIGRAAELLDPEVVLDTIAVSSHIEFAEEVSDTISTSEGDHDLYYGAREPVPDREASDIELDLGTGVDSDPSDPD